MKTSIKTIDYKSIGRELRALRAAHKDDEPLQVCVNDMLRAMRSYRRLLALPVDTKVNVEDATANIDRGFAHGLAWLGAWAAKPPAAAS